MWLGFTWHEYVGLSRPHCWSAAIQKPLFAAAALRIAVAAYRIRARHDLGVILFGLSERSGAAVLIGTALAGAGLIALGSGAAEVVTTGIRAWAASDWMIAGGVALGALAAALAIGEVWTRWRWAGPIALIGLAILAAAVGTSAWIYGHDETENPAANSLKIGILVAGALGAAVTLFINDRRRMTESSRAHTESLRLEQDRLRTEDERFTRAVELLGHEAPEVRVGALHALMQTAITHNVAGTADPQRVQAALDVMCGYLRHDRVSRAGSSQDASDETAVRQTALDAVLHLARTLTAPAGAEPYVVNLRGATLSKLVCRRVVLHTHFDMTDAIVLGDTDLEKAVFVGSLLCVRTQFRGTMSIAGATLSRHTSFVRARFSGDADFSRARFGARGDFRSASFEGDLRMSHVRFAQPSIFQRCNFAMDVDFSNARFADDATFRRAVFLGRVAFTQASFSRKATFNGATFARMSNIFGRTTFVEAPTVERTQMNSVPFLLHSRPSRD